MAGGDAMMKRLIGSYTILAPLGAGGMGEVYRAHDSKLGRDVAIKILPEHFTADPEHRARFGREARILATLNHPNIGAIYGLEESDGLTALVLELVEGTTLAERLVRGPLKPSQAAAIARQIADALDAAHERGIVHRDLKPANIMLQGTTDSDQRAKVLDFGLAKPASGHLGEETEKTTSIGLTMDGRIVGTPAYMSPEQARGQSVDARTDVWAFGCVLYEMIAGRQAFRGATTSDTIARILERDPDWEILPSSTPASLRRLLTRCLEKDPKRRLHAIADANFDLDDALLDGQPVAADAARSRSGAWRWLIIGVPVAMVVAAVVWTQLQRPAPGPDLPAARVAPLTSYRGIEASPTFSPKGDQVAFSWDGENADNDDIWVVLVGADTPLQLTKDPARDVSPAWKPDGSRIAFARVEASRASIYLVSPHGGSEQKLADFSTVLGDAVPVETLDPRLSWSPDGRWLAVSRVTSGPERGVFVLGADGRKALLLAEEADDSYRMATFSPNGDRLACINDGYLEVSPVRVGDPPEVTGPPRRVSPYLGYVSGLAWTADGTSLVFGRSRYPAPDAPYLWRLSASGDGTPERIDLAGVAGYPSMSASGSVLAFARRGLNVDPLLLQPGRSPEALLASTSNEQDASFSPNGQKVAFATDRTGEGNEIWVALRSDAASRRSVTNGAHKPEGSPRWSPDGKRLAFDGLGDDGSRHVYIVDEAGGQIQTIPTKAGASDQIPSWSHDGKWIYFSSNRSGRYEIWRAPADAGSPVQITTAGGREPFESPDGRTLYFSRSIDGVRTVFAMPVAGGQERNLGITVTFWNYVPGEGGLFYMPPRLGQKAPYTYEVRFFDLATGQSRLLHTVRLATASPGLSVLADGLTVLIAGVDEVTQDLMRIDNFR